MNEVVSAQRLHIGFFGRRNAGKSSLVNAITGQALAVVSPVAGTTTDPVQKAMELLPLGPVVIIDTPGFDDEGELGALRVERTRKILGKTDLAVLVVDSQKSLSPEETAFLQDLENRHIPHLLVHSKADLLTHIPDSSESELWVSAKQNMGIHALKERLARMAQNRPAKRPLLPDVVKPGDAVILVTPIDESAPKGRLILPQQQTLRALLDRGCIALVCQPPELAATLKQLTQPPKLVITDSQVFDKVEKILPDTVLLTSFSILFARYKGQLETQIQGTSALKHLKNGGRLLICEGCTHHRQCGDIGTVKLPQWIREYAGCELSFDFVSGGDFPTDLSGYDLVIHCGGCMLNDQEMGYRMALAQSAGVPAVNYGLAIAQMQGILERSLEPFQN